MKKIIAVLMVCMMFSVQIASASASPMLSPYTPSWEYGMTDEQLNGYIPALQDTVTRPWELAQWKAIFNFDGGKSSTITNYDVFNVKKNANDVDFDKENGFGLVYKSTKALGDLFDAIVKGQDIEAKQLKYYRDTFIESANDTDFKSGNSFYYEVQSLPFLRIPGIVQRLGAKFDSTKKVGENERQALYTVSKFPTLTVTMGEALNINYKAYGYTNRSLRIVAIPKGAFPSFKKVISLNGGKLITTSSEAYSGKLTISNYDEIRDALGENVDIVLEDGYGRTAIQSVKLPDINALDFIPTDLSLTDSGQLWVKFKYQGDDFTSADYINSRGIPMLTKVTVTGADKSTQTLQSLYTESSKMTKNGQTYTFYLGKVNIGKKAGRYTIKATTTINNPNHSSRALEVPSKAYDNNSIDGQWTRDLTDLIAQSVTASPSSIKVGDSTAISAKIKNVGAITQSSVLIRFYSNGETIYEANKTLPANQVTTVGPFEWTGSVEGNSNIMVEVDPAQKVEDIDRSNNQAFTTCSVISKDTVAGSCNGPSANKSWKVTYPKITGYNMYGNPIWQYVKVNYSESLKMSATVNTKQGIPTDLDHPKESDRESRGSWEIIPWSKKNGKNPNEVTRAGYGFELNVDINYTTDWETKVPKGLSNTAKKIGGTYTGPDKVTAYIRNVQGALVGTKNLQLISGTKNKGKWVFPEHTVVSSSGNSYTDRKFYTDVWSKDGYYKITIISSKSGKSGFSVCTTKTVEVYGSMYDDTQELRAVD